MPLMNLLRALFLVTLRGPKHGHVYIGNARIQRGGGGRESGTPWNTTSAIEKSNWAPSPWKRLELLTFPPPPRLDLGKIIVS